MAGIRIIPTITFLMIALEAGSDFVETERELDAIKRHVEGAVKVLGKARSLGLK